MKSRASDKAFADNVIYQLLQDSNGPILWADLVAKAKIKHISNIRVLRRDFKDLKRSGRIYQDESGYYSLIESSELVQGVVTKTGNALFCEGYELVTGLKIHVRAGDEIEGFLRDGKVVLIAVKKLSKKPIIGIVSLIGRDCVVESLDTNLKGRIFVSKDSITEISRIRAGDSVEVELVDRFRQGFRGELLRKIESASVLEQAIRTTIKNHDIPSQWPSSFEQSLKDIRGEISKKEYETRVDLTALPFVTIDGETAKDFDDAVYAEPLKDGGWQIFVAIADVCHYVKANSPMDIEARNRGTSVYFPDTVVPMLPEQLSNDLCSLKEHCDRLVLVCQMSLDAEGDLQGFGFYEAVICSQARLTYDEVQSYFTRRLISTRLTPEIMVSLGHLYSTYKSLAQNRLDRGALNFSTSEAALVLAHGTIEEISLEKKHDAHRLIEEMMLLTNVCASKFLEEKSSQFLYRNHESPDPIKLSQLKQVLSTLGFALDINELTPKYLQELLVRILDKPKGEIYQQLVLKSLKQAMYQPENKGHFGLALGSYTHFTSPIRRYPDLLAHRCMKSVLNGSQLSKEYSHDDLIEFGRVCSETERRAEIAGWAVDTWLKCDYLMNRIGDSLEGWIAGVTEFGLFVELKDYFVQGLLHVANLGDDFYKFYPNSSSLVGESSGRAFRFGESIKVRISSIEPAQGKIELELDQGVSIKKRYQKKKRRRRVKREQHN